MDINVNELEMKCRALAKKKKILIRKSEHCITLHYNVTISRQSRNFHSWEEILKFIQKYQLEDEE